MLHFNVLTLQVNWHVDCSTYDEAGWLTTQFASHTSVCVSLEYALGNLMNPGSEPTAYGDVQTRLDQAALNYKAKPLIPIVSKSRPMWAQRHLLGRFRNS